MILVLQYCNTIFTGHNKLCGVGNMLKGYMTMPYNAEYNFKQSGGYFFFKYIYLKQSQSKFYFNLSTSVSMKQ